MQASTCCRGEFPSPQSIVHTYDDHPTPASRPSTLSILHPPCQALYFRPWSLRTRRISRDWQSKSTSPVLCFQTFQTPHILQETCNVPQSVADSEMAYEHCHVRKAHVSSPARQSRLCRRSQPRHPLYQPYRVHEEGQSFLFESWWWLALYACVCMT